MMPRMARLLRGRSSGCCAATSRSTSCCAADARAPLASPFERPDRPTDPRGLHAHASTTPSTGPAATSTTARCPTAVLGIATADGVVALDAFGAASVDDHYPLFSMTKPIVGLAALRLVEQGRLTAETPLTRAVPEFGAGRDDVVRLRHLVEPHLGHRRARRCDTPDGPAPLAARTRDATSRPARCRGTRRSRSRASPR